MKKGKSLLELWKIRQEAEGYDVSGVNTLEEAEHFFDNNPPKKAEKLAEQPQDNSNEDESSTETSAEDEPHEPKKSTRKGSKKADEV